MHSESHPAPSSTPGGPGGESDAAFLAAYRELRAVAQRLFAMERRDHTLQATALVHEAFLRLQSCGDRTAGDPARFRRAAAQAMRRILIEHARGKQRVKRGGGQLPAALDSIELATSGRFEQVLHVDEAIELLAAEAPALAELVRLRFYAGLEVREAAEALGISERSAQRDWTCAKARLFQLLGEIA